MQYKKWEDPKLAPLKQRLFLIHFLYRTIGDYTWELRKVKSNSNSNSNHPLGNNPDDLSKLPAMAKQIKHWPS